MQNGIFLNVFCSGRTDIEQLQIIFNFLGTPNPADWPDVTQLPAYIEFEQRDSMNSRHLFNDAKGNSYKSVEEDLLLNLLKLNPNKRISASDVRIYFRYYNIITLNI